MRRSLLLVGAAVAALPAIIAGAALPETEAAERGAEFVIGTQQPDGGFGGFGAGQTWDAIFGLRAVGYDPAELEKEGNTPADFLRANAEDAAAAGPAAAGKAALAAKALGLDPADVGGTDLIGAVNAGLNSSTGEYADNAFSQGIAMLGLACTENDVPAAAANPLRDAQLEDGGWGDPDTTSIALQALLAAGAPASDETVTSAIAFLRETQYDDGGWGFDGVSNATSTAYVVQSLIAAGEDVESAAYTKGGATPIAYLLSQQQPDGSFEGFDPALAAAQVLPAIMGRTFCDAPEAPIRSTNDETPAASPSPGSSETATVSPSPTPATSAQSEDDDDDRNWTMIILVTTGAVLGAGVVGALVGKRVTK